MPGHREEMQTPSDEFEVLLMNHPTGDDKIIILQFYLYFFYPVVELEQMAKQMDTLHLEVVVT